MKKFTPEMIEKAKAAKNAEEILAIAKANNVELTAEEAAAYFAELNELSDDALDGAVGGVGLYNEESAIERLAKAAGVSEGISSKW